MLRYRRELRNSHVTYCASLVEYLPIWKKNSYFIPLFGKGWGETVVQPRQLLFFLWPCACLIIFRSRLLFFFFFRFLAHRSYCKNRMAAPPSRTGRKKGGVPCFSALAHLFGSDGRKTGFPLPCLFINNKCSFCILPCFPSFGYNALIIPIQERKFVLHLHLHIYLPILFHC